MRSFVLTIVLGVSALGAIALTPGEADAQFRWRRGYYPGYAYPRYGYGYPNYGAYYGGGYAVPSYYGGYSYPSYGSYYGGNPGYVSPGYGSYTYTSPGYTYLSSPSVFYTPGGYIIR